jgi:hypothetical protein
MPLNVHYSREERERERERERRGGIKKERRYREREKEPPPLPPSASFPDLATFPLVSVLTHRFLQYGEAPIMMGPSMEPRRQGRGARGALYGLTASFLLPFQTIMVLSIATAGDYTRFYGGGGRYCSGRRLRTEMQ